MAKKEKTADAPASAPAPDDKGDKEIPEHLKGHTVEEYPNQGTPDPNDGKTALERAFGDKH